MLFLPKQVKEALLFYGCAETYKRRGIHPKGSPVRYEAAPIVQDHGGRARAALDELERLSFRHRIRRLFRGKGTGKALRTISTPAPLNPQSSLGLVPSELADTNEA